MKCKSHAVTHASLKCRLAPCPRGTPACCSCCLPEQGPGSPALRSATHASLCNAVEVPVATNHGQPRRGVWPGCGARRPVSRWCVKGCRDGAYAACSTPKPCPHLGSNTRPGQRAQPPAPSQAARCPRYGAPWETWPPSRGCAWRRRRCALRSGASSPPSRASALLNPGGGKSMLPCAVGNHFMRCGGSTWLCALLFGHSAPCPLAPMHAPSPRAAAGGASAGAARRRSTTPCWPLPGRQSRRG